MDVSVAKAAGDAAFQSGAHAVALSHYTAALAAAEETGDVQQLHLLYSNRAAARLALGDAHGALVDAQCSVAIEPSWAKGWFRSARALHVMGRAALARAAAAEAARLAPTSSEVRELLRLLHREQGARPLQQQQQQQQQASHRQQDDFTTSPCEWRARCVLRRSLRSALLPPALQPGAVYLPAPDGVCANLLLLLHGLGDSPAPFAALARRMGLPQTACLALPGPLVVPGTDGGRAWHEAFDPSTWELIQPAAGETRRTSSLATTLTLLQQELLPALSAAGGWVPSELQVLGFSQGGTVALELARVVAVSAALLQETLDREPVGEGRQQHRAQNGSTQGGVLSDDAESSNSMGTDVLITHGDADDVVPVDLVQRSVDVLKRCGCSVQQATLPGKAHGMIDSPAEMRAAMEFWGTRLRSRPADASFVEVPAPGGAASRRPQ